ncbi:MAG: 1,3-beta-glucanase, partial [Solirubrobacterales bacterium]
MDTSARKSLSALLLFTALALAAPFTASAAPPGAGWTLAAADEFNGTSLSPAWDTQRYDYWL